MPGLICRNYRGDVLWLGVFARGAFHKRQGDDDICRPERACDTEDMKTYALSYGASVVHSSVPTFDDLCEIRRYLACDAISGREYVERR